MTHERELRTVDLAIMYLVALLAAILLVFLFAVVSQADDHYTLEAPPGSMYIYTGQIWGGWEAPETVEFATITSEDLPLTFVLSGQDGRLYSFELRVKWGTLEKSGRRRIPEGAMPELEIVFVGMEKKK